MRRRGTPGPWAGWWRGALWPGLAGLAQAASLALPGSGAPVWGLQLASMGGLAWLLQGARRPAQGAWIGLVFAWAWLTGTFWWLFISMHTYGGLAAPLAVLAVLALAAFLASYYGVVSWLFCRLSPENRAVRALFFGAIWTLAELARGQWWTGFPWGAGGYAHPDGPLAPLARWIGVYGLGGVAAALAMLVVQVRWRDAVSPKAWSLALGAVALLIGAAWQRDCALGLSDDPVCLTAAPASAVQPPPPLDLALLQGNIPQDEKFQPGSGVPLALDWYARALRGATAALVVAPETAIPLLPDQLMPGYLDDLAAPFAQGGRAALLGIPLGNERLGYTNSVLGWRAGAATLETAYRYDKHHLVPFGEFIPPFFKWFTQMMNIPLGDFNRGALAPPPFAWRGERIAPHICYEDLFGEELGARFTDPAQAPTVFVNLSNIAWFGDSLAIDQHLQIGRMRALEFERPMVRATNTGATAVIDHRGQVTHRLPSQVREVLHAHVQGRGQGGEGITPYAGWVARWGLWPLWGLGLLALVLAAWGKRSSRLRPQPLRWRG